MESLFIRLPVAVSLLHSRGDPNSTYPEVKARADSHQK